MTCLLLVPLIIVIYGTYRFTGYWRGHWPWPTSCVPSACCHLAGFLWTTLGWKYYGTYRLTGYCLGNWPWPTSCLPSACCYLAGTMWLTLGAVLAAPNVHTASIMLMQPDMLRLAMSMALTPDMLMLAGAMQPDMFVLAVAMAVWLGWKPAQEAARPPPPLSSGWTGGWLWAAAKLFGTACLYMPGFCMVCIYYACIYRLLVVYLHLPTMVARPAMVAMLAMFVAEAGSTARAAPAKPYAGEAEAQLQRELVRTKLELERPKDELSEPEATRAVAEGRHSEPATSAPPAGRAVGAGADSSAPRETFTQAGSFAGYREDYVFKLGPLGLGYYLEGEAACVQQQEEVAAAASPTNELGFRNTIMCELD